MKKVVERLVAMRDELNDLIRQLEPETEVKNFPNPKGRPKSAIFHEWVDEELLANCISGLHQRYFDHTCRMMVVDNETYGETDFMLCVYCALVKLRLAPSVIHNQVNKQYYRFLTDVCRIKLTEKERTYNNHLNKVIRTGCDLHLLTEDIVIKKQSHRFPNASKCFKTTKNLIFVTQSYYGRFGSQPATQA